MKCIWMLRQEPKKTPVFLASLLAAMKQHACISPVMFH